VQFAEARTGTDHGVMRELNRSLVLDVLRDSSPTTRSFIARTTSLARPTVSDIVDDLIQEGLVRELGRGMPASAGGRPPILLEFNERSQFVAGVHVGSTTTTIVISDARAKEVARRQMATPRGDALSAVRTIGNEIKTSARVSGTPWSRLTSVGIALPGLTDFGGGVCILAPHVGWRNVPVRDVLAKMLGRTVFVHHVCQAAAVAESIEGAAQGTGNIVLLYAGTGLGSGILYERRVFHGHTGIAGEIGHCRIPGENEPCTCGKFGCLETVASVGALVRFVREGLAQAGRTSISGATARSPITPRAVGAAAAAGDPVALSAVTRVAQNLGLAASWLVNLFNPAVLLVAGGIADLGELVLQPLRETLAELAMSDSLQQVEVRASALGQDAEVRGAVLLALQQSERYYQVVFQA
jgi:glucokinase-like ROK family protein